MAERNTVQNVAAIEAEEHLLIDVQFLLQQVLTDKGISRSQLAKAAGVSKARLSQFFGAEANPTLKSCARMFHSLGEALEVGLKPSCRASVGAEYDGADWRIAVDEEARHRRRTTDDDRLVAAVTESFAACNDNGFFQVEFLDRNEALMDADASVIAEAA